MRDYDIDTFCSLSSPFMDSTSACGFFDLILGLFVEADVDVSGKLIGKCSHDTDARLKSHLLYSSRRGSQGMSSVCSVEGNYTD